MSATQGVSSGSEFDSFIDERKKKKSIMLAIRESAKIRMRNWPMKREDMNDKDLELKKLEKYQSVMEKEMDALSVEKLCI